MWSQTWISYSSAWCLLFILKTSVLKAPFTDARLTHGPQVEGILGERDSWADDWCSNSRALRKRGLTQANPANCCCKKKPGSAVIFSVCAFQREKVNVNMCVKVCVCASRLASSGLAVVFHNGTEAGGRWGIDWLNPHIATQNQQTPLHTSLLCNDLPVFWLLLHLITLNLYLMSSLQNKCTETKGINWMCWPISV